jgi:hypothetical protein
MLPVYFDLKPFFPPAMSKSLAIVHEQYNEKAHDQLLRILSIVFSPKPLTHCTTSRKFSNLLFFFRRALSISLAIFSAIFSGNLARFNLIASSF